MLPVESAPSGSCEPSLKNPGALQAMIEAITPQIERVIRRRLPKILRSKLDSHDLVQATWCSVLSHASRLCRFRSEKDLAAYVKAVAGNKVALEVRRFLCWHKYDVRRECRATDSSADLFATISCHVPSPSEMAIARERWFELCRDLPPRQRMILELRFQGLTYDEIAHELGIDECTARRAIKRIERGYQSHAS